ncbi:MAG: GntR family transcriptional regulator [Acidobacteriota bacterium]
MVPNAKAVSLTRITSQTKVEQVQRAILEAIFSGELRPGDRVLEAQLAGQLGVAQATVNQALLELHSQGVVLKSLGKSTTVRRFGREELEALFMVREPLESAAGVAASRHATLRSVDLLRVWVDRMRAAAKADDLSKFYLADYEFHQELYRLSDNPFLFQACQAIAAAPFAYLLSGHLELMPVNYLQVADDHEEIIEALLEGESKAIDVIGRKMKRWLKVQLEFLQSPQDQEKDGTGS